MENIQEKDLAPIKKEALDVEQVVSGYEIAKVEDMTGATEILSRIKLVSKTLKEKKESATGPINTALKNIRSWFAPVEDQLKKADSEMRNKMSSFQMEEDRKAEAERKRIAKELKEEQDRIDNDKRLKGETKEEKKEQVVDEAMDKMDNVDEGHQTKFKAESGSVHFRTDKIVTIDDPSKLPAEYLMPDVKKIEKVAKAGVVIPGVSVREIKTVVNR